MKPKDYADLLMRTQPAAQKNCADDTPEGWHKTIEVVRLLGYNTRAGVALPVAQVQDLGRRQGRS
jgi:hypothetical protein